MLEIVAPGAARRGPLDGRVPFGAASSVRVSPAPPTARFVLRGGAEARAAFGAVLGLAMSDRVGATSEREGVACLCLGPDEILALAPNLDALADWDGPGAAVDVGHRQTALLVAGPLGADLLNAGCPLDLHRRVFPAGRCTRTLLGKAEIVLWRRDTGLHVEVARSFAAYAWDFLQAAAR